jgi:hypothetical protein
MIAARPGLERSEHHMPGRGRWFAVGVVVALFAAGCVPEWTTYHHDNARSGADLSAPSITPVANAWTSPVLDGLVFANPLVYHDRVYVATENNTIYARVPPGIRRSRK